MLISIIPKTIIARIVIVTTNIIAKRTLIVNVIIIAPNTINGERIKRRKKRLTPVCTVLTSAVSLVISVDVPILSD